MSYPITLIKKGDKFCEHNGAQFGARFIAITDAVLREDGCWRVDGEFTDHKGEKKIVEFSSHKDFMEYGPKLYPGDRVPYLGIIYLNDVAYSVRAA